MPVTNSIIQLKRGLAADWAYANPVLFEGEIGLEMDTRKLKFGDGVTAWNSLAYGIPQIAITETFVVASQAAMLALVAQTGDVAVRSDEGKSYILSAEPASTLINWVELLTAGQVTQVNGQSGVVTLTAANVGADPAGTGASEAGTAVGTHESTYNHATFVTQTEIDSSITAHLTGDPHPQYLTPAEGDAAYEPINANIQAHIGSNTNPHGVTAGQVGAAPSVHGHAISDITNLQTELNGKLVAGDPLRGPSLKIESAPAVEITDKRSASPTPTSAAGTYIIDSFALATYRGGEYLVFVQQGSVYEVVKLLVIHDGTTPEILVFGRTTSPSASATDVEFEVGVNASNVEVRYSQTSTNTVTLRTVRELMVV